MTKKDINNLKSLIGGSIVIIGLLLWNKLPMNFSAIYYLLGLFLGGAIVAEIICSFIPVKKTKRKTANKRTKKVKSKSVNNKDIPPNILRSKKEILTLPLEKISWREFEEICYLYYKAKGCRPRRTSEGADGGVDLIIYSKKDMAYEAVQIKHYINSGRQIDVRPIRELDSAKKNEGCPLGRFIASTTFTNPAMIEAGDRRIETNSIEWVRSTLDTWRRKEATRLKYE
ncbi:restriction endonuclease [Gracilibacillus caseinilyticus]|uniref:Restriction endonuclease n=1 Tax=Gracilibacillus caseinilyticus TaxID=2932256 RepID=A0ABY4ETV9_9BACI|nr:restriction endonuclease [Gracilibacillus caseinilyticus]UOQ47207.1 restriction endonuclease [Gracilibacillus caseinilyticus]